MPDWSDDQKKVIDARDHNLLVSAAAGSGKTAVLVERIIRRILDPEKPIDVDRIVVVTFTKAAAAEMRERVLLAINAALEKDPEDERLARQATLVHSAQITTIDSFCVGVVRNHFNEIGIDPDFRVIDPSEEKVFRAKVMEDLLAQEYADGMKRCEHGETSAFLTFASSYNKANSDDSIISMIESLYNKAQSYPWPDSFYAQLLEPYRIERAVDIIKTPWYQAIAAEVRETIATAREEEAAVLPLCEQECTAYKYIGTLKRDIAQYDAALSTADDEQFMRLVAEIDYETIGKGAKKNPELPIDDEIAAHVKGVRDQQKEVVNKLRDKYCHITPAEILSQMQLLRPHAEELVRLCTQFTEAYDAYKRKRGVVDFSDIERFALYILRDKETGERTAVAREYASYYEEIMIDEYQDSNYMQEAILSSIARDEDGVYNRFMVGDVKQSIYGFRQACPKIFTEKYHAYHADAVGCMAIDLHQNFRSRPEVLDFCNDIFYRLMHEDIGDVEYDALAALEAGAKDYPVSKEVSFAPEILIGEKGEDKEELEELGIDDNTSLEARMIADKIKLLMETQKVTDKETKRFRPLRYKDIVVLLRETKKSADLMVSTFLEQGIPAYCQKKSGYFNAVEVETVLNLLCVVDNPRQDIPLASVLHSPMFGFSDDTLFFIRQQDPSVALIDNLFQWQEAHPEDTHVSEFLTRFEEMRTLSHDMKIHDFLDWIYASTEYRAYVSAMPQGALRRANLDKLIELAIAYENTSQHGVFHFVKNIERMREKEVDLGEASLSSENDDAVAVMTIHSSKGLEYPIVFVSGLGKKFSGGGNKDQTLLLSQDAMGLTYKDYEQQMQVKPFYKLAVKAAIDEDECGERMRLFYVAMTRAKERLFLTATVQDIEKTLAKWEDREGGLTHYTRLHATSFIEWTVRATAPLRDRYPIFTYGVEDIVATEALGAAESVDKRATLAAAAAKVSCEDLAELEAKLRYAYPYANVDQYKNKYSVSEVKHRRMEEAFVDDLAARPEFLEEEVEELVPSFLSGAADTGTSPGALRGTAVHRYLECYDFAAAGKLTPEDQLDAMLVSRKLTKEQAKLLYMPAMKHFLDSDVARRMREASLRGDLYREQPFVMRESVADLFDDPTSEEEVLIQGIIDVYFIEDEQITVLDYKTDRVSSGEELAKRYRAQLQLYAKALGRALDLPVQECLLYSFSLEETVVL